MTHRGLGVVVMTLWSRRSDQMAAALPDNFSEEPHSGGMDGPPEILRAEAPAAPSWAICQVWPA